MRWRKEHPGRGKRSFKGSVTGKSMICSGMKGNQCGRVSQAERGEKGVEETPKGRISFISS